jgi:hypothetical protein
MSARRRFTKAIKLHVSPAMNAQLTAEADHRGWSVPT